MTVRLSSYRKDWTSTSSSNDSLRLSRLEGSWGKIIEKSPKLNWMNCLDLNLSHEWRRSTEIACPLSKSCWTSIQVKACMMSKTRQMILEVEEAKRNTSNCFINKSKWTDSRTTKANQWKASSPSKTLKTKCTCTATITNTEATTWWFRIISSANLRLLNRGRSRKIQR